MPIRKVDKYTVYNDIWSTDRRLTLRADRVESLPVRYVRSPLPWLPCPSARAGATAPPPRACPRPVPRHPEVVHGDEGVRMRAAALMEFPICDWNRGPVLLFPQLFLGCFFILKIHDSKRRQASFAGRPLNPEDVTSKVQIAYFIGEHTNIY